MKRSAPKILLALALASAACSSAAEVPKPLPGLSLASAAPAQLAFRPLLKRWSSAQTKAERAAVAADLEAFVTKFPDDGLVPAASALLAWVAVEKGDLVAGKRLSRPAATLGPGSWQDFSFVVDGAIRLRNSDAPGALKILKPLVGTLIDPWARDLLNDEVISAAIVARDPALAVKTMSVWLREAGDEERQLIGARVDAALRAMVDADLIKIYDERAARQQKTEGEIDALLAKRLAQLAINARDAVLAKKLLTNSGAQLGDKGDDIARLAAGAAATRIDARTVGLLLSFRSAETRRRSAEVAAGVAWGLELPGSGARLVARNDSGGDDSRIDEALTELGREGAAVIIAGVADEDARRAAEFAERQRVPVILITRPPSLRAPRGRASFVLPLGSSPQTWVMPADEVFGKWIGTYGARPSFWAAAGRDAAVIAKRSVKDLPEAATEDRTEVEARRLAVQKALAERVDDGLWTVAAPAPAPATTTAPATP